MSDLRAAAQQVLNAHAIGRGMTRAVLNLEAALSAQPTDDADALTIAYSSGYERGKDAGRADRLTQPIALAGVVMRFADRDVKLTVLEREYVDDRYCLIVAPQPAQSTDGSEK